MILSSGNSQKPRTVHLLHQSSTDVDRCVCVCATPFFVVTLTISSLVLLTLSRNQ